MFAPDLTMSRAMAATVLYRLAGEPDVTSVVNPFDDVKKGDWYSDAVLWASQSNIVYGYTSKDYAPNDDITRADFVTMLLRYASHKNLKLPEKFDKRAEFTDSDETPDYAKLPVNVLYYADIIRGKTIDIFAPDDNITRAEAVALIRRFTDTAENQRSSLLDKYGLSIAGASVLSNQTPQPVDEIKSSDYLMVSLNRYSTDVKIPEIKMSAKAIYRSYKSGILISMANTDDSSQFKGDVVGLPEIKNGEIFKVNIEIKIGEETGNLTLYPIVKVIE